MVVHESSAQLRLSDDEVDRIFRALADRTRRDIVRRTLVGEVSVSALASSYDMSFAAVQKHVAVLEVAGLVSKHPQGRERLVHGNPDTIRRAQSLLDQFEQVWRDRVARLDAIFDEDDSSQAATTRRPDGDAAGHAGKPTIPAGTSTQSGASSTQPIHRPHPHS